MTTDGRPRALWVTALAPSPSGGGGHIRQAHLLAALAERFDVHLVVAGRCDDAGVRAVAASVTEVDADPDPPPPPPLVRRWRDLRDVVVRRQHVEVAAHAAVRRALAPVLARLQPAELVQVEYMSLAPLVAGRQGGHWAVTLHNLGSGMARHRRDVAPNARARLFHGIAAANAARAEAAVVAAYDTTIACSEEDAASLGGSVLVVPNGVDLARFTPSPVPAAPHVVFLGALNTDPNVDGVRWLVEHVWPLVRAERPEARLSVVGMAPVPDVVAACKAPGVTLHADVPSTEPYLRDARIAVVPLHVGTGTRLKALEAMAAGRPVVGTTIGLAGLAVRDGTEVLVADEAAPFAAAIGALLGDDELAAALAARARAVVEDRYGWERIGRRYADELAARALERATRR